MILDKSLGIKRVSGQKADKARVTAALTYNATETQKHPIWFTGKSLKSILLLSSTDIA